ncbi:hypothetical protein ACIRSJ_23730 [Streptomyces virginiae]|nr:hypothetical protein [Streptomyces sp. CMAA1738]MEC4570592.1 hypothetical protein [Streptomyces sp. CMAA1738]
MPDEGGVHDGHPLIGGYAGQCGGGVLGTGGRADLEAEGAELVRER